MLAEIGWFVVFCLWTLGVYLVAKYLGQGEAYRAGMSAGFSEGWNTALDEPETFEGIAGLWSDDGFGNPQTTQAHRDCIRPEANK